MGEREQLLQAGRTSPPPPILLLLDPWAIAISGPRPHHGYHHLDNERKRRARARAGLIESQLAPAEQLLLDAILSEGPAGHSANGPKKVQPKQGCQGLHLRGNELSCQGSISSAYVHSLSSSPQSFPKISWIRNKSTQNAILPCHQAEEVCECLKIKGTPL